MRVDEPLVSDNRWHRIVLFQGWENVKLQLDDTVQFRILTQRSFVFGNLKTNSDVFIGGVPKDIHLLASMSSPLMRHAKTFGGGVKNLVYRLYPQGVTAPQLMDSVGLRQSDDDYCKPAIAATQVDSYCKNDGLCYSTNEGPKCDCSFSDYDGRRCEQPKSDAELSFFGQEWLGYDVSNNSAATVRSRFENITFAFKSVHGHAVLFFSGDSNSFLHVTLDNGSIVATSKFSGTEKRLLRMFNEYPSGRYDDDAWHTVTVIRTMTLMSLTVNGKKDEIRQYAPDVEWLTNAFSYVGGVPKEREFSDMDKPNFRGCIKKVKYESGAYLLNFIALADQGYGQSVIRSAGDLAFSCRKPTVPPDVLSFNSGQHFITLPKWNSLASGSIGFQLRTYELDGLILYHGTKASANESADYIAFELIDGHLFLIINLGSGHVRLQTTATKITEGTVWHSVMLERIGRTGTVIVDNIRTDFSTPGVSANLIIDEPIYIGAVPWPANDSTPTSFRFPSTVWTANLRQGYVGCLKNVRINGISAKIATVFEEQSASVEDGVSQGCPNTLNSDYCISSPCKNFGRCEIGYATYRCDCSNSFMEGPSCDVEPDVVELLEGNDEMPSFHLPNPLHSEAETIECKFRTDDEKGIIFDTKSTATPSHRILITLLRGELELHLDFGVGRHTFNWGSGLNDNQFHSVRVKRRGEKLLLFLDGKWEHNYFLPSSNIVIQVDQLAAGHSLHSSAASDFGSPLNETNDENFTGQMIKLTFNGYDVLRNAKRKAAGFGLQSKSSEARDGQKSRNRKAKYAQVSFESNNGRAVFSSSRVNAIQGPYRISFKFRTLASSCLLLVIAPNSTRGGNFVAVELVDGRIRYTFGIGLRYESIMSPVLPHSHTLNDMRLHSLLIYQSGKNGEHYMIVDNTSAVMDSVAGAVAKINGQIFLGGLPPGATASPKLAEVVGFRGCISSLRIGDQQLDVFSDAEEVVGVSKGCPGPLPRCSTSTCANNGKCIQKWNSVKCDCSLSTYGGERCDSPGTTYVFDSSSSMIYYEYSPSERPSTNRDLFAVGFQTRQSSAVLLSVQCTVDGDYLTLFLRDGYLFVQYNLGSGNHLVGLRDVAVNDDSYHVVRAAREEANLTLYLDNRPPVQYTPIGKAELFTLNMQWRISVGASFHAYHQPYRARAKREKIYDAFHGKLAGVNFNNLMILDLLAQGSPKVHRIGAPLLLYMSSSDYVSGGVGSLIRANPLADSSFDNTFPAASEEGLIQAEGSGCVSYEEQQNCQIADPDPVGLITAVLPVSEPAATPSAVSRGRAPSGVSQLNETSQSLRASTAASAIAPKTTIPKSTFTNSVYAVRPTTPMGDLMATTAKDAAATADFPRTALISIASLSVIIIIAIVVFCVFRCRQSGPSTDQYPMVCNGKQAGYAPIPTEMSPQMMHSEHVSPPAIAPFLQTRASQLNGYQPIKGAVIPNANGVNGVKNGNGVTNGRKKEFKEWYV